MSFTPNYISQRDPRWVNEKLGFDSTVTIGTDGCTLTCLTMLVNGYGFSETPSTMNRKLKDMGSGVGFSRQPDCLARIDPGIPKDRLSRHHNLPRPARPDQ